MHDQVDKDRDRILAMCLLGVQACILLTWFEQDPVVALLLGVMLTMGAWCIRTFMRVP